MADNVERVLILTSRLKVVIEIIGLKIVKKKQEKLLNNLLLLVLPLNQVSHHIYISRCPTT